MNAHEVALLAYADCRRQIDLGLSPRPVVVAACGGEWNGSVVLAPQAVGDTEKTWRDVGGWLAGQDADAAWVVIAEAFDPDVGVVRLVGLDAGGKSCASARSWLRSPLTERTISWLDEEPCDLPDGPMVDGIRAGFPVFCPRCRNEGTTERLATPEEVDSGCELGVWFDPCPDPSHKRATLTDEEMRHRGHEVIDNSCEECGVPGASLVDVSAGEHTQRFRLCDVHAQQADDGVRLEVFDGADR